MEKLIIYTRVAMPIALICLSAAIAYFSYAALDVIRKMPELITQTGELSDSINQAFDQVDSITELVPEILREVAQVREQIPPLLSQVEAVQQQIPSILQEVQAVRGDILPILDEFVAYREVIPQVISEVEIVRRDIQPILDEFAAYREVIPQVLTEIEATRVMIPATLDRAETIVLEASNAGKDASEGAVSGFFSGIIKAPMVLVKDFGAGLFPGTNISVADEEAIKTAAIALLETGRTGDSRRWQSKTSKITGQMTLIKEEIIEDRNCRTLKLSLQAIGETIKTICAKENGTWNIEQE